MQLTTKYFGTVECEESDVLRFADGLFGFEKDTQFVLLPFSDSDGAMLCLQSVQTPQLAFVAMNPFFLSSGYAPKLKPTELEQLGVSANEELCYYVLCAVKRPVSESTVNMKCPVVINDRTRSAMQVILEDDSYEMRSRLAEFSKKAGDGSC